MRRKPTPRELDRAIARIADRQAGVVERRQLIDLGLHPRAIDRRIAARRLVQLHRNVYALGHRRLTREGHWLAAVLAAGRRAVLSHRSAAALWRIRADDGCIDLTAPSKRKRPGLRIARTRLEPDEVTHVRGIPVTTVARTLLDLGTVLEPPQLMRALREAQYLRMLNVAEMQLLLDRYPGRRGTAAMRSAITAVATVRGITRSELEERFVLLLSKADLSPPELNATIALGDMTIEADAVWRDHKLIVELDGGASHKTDEQFESDRARDRALALAGWLVIRVTWRQLTGDGQRVVRDLRALLDAREVS